MPFEMTQLKPRTAHRADVVHFFPRYRSQKEERQLEPADLRNTKGGGVKYVPLDPLLSV